jgi:hypothetical protein
LIGDRSEGVDRAWWSGRSSKPRRRRLRQLRWVRFPHAPATFLGLALATVWAPRLAPAQAPDTSVNHSPPTVHQLKPLPAFFQSLAVPGWAQSKLDRKLTGSLFVVWEGVTLGMFLKAGGEVRYLQRTGADSTRLDAKRRERQDWLVLLGFNHLFSGLEAYVSSQLQDFPGDVRFRPAPRGYGLEALVPIRIP